MTYQTLHAGSRLRDFALRRLVVVPADATLQEAARRMRDENVSSIVIGAPGDPIAIITERDVTQAAADNRPNDVPVAELAVQPLVIDWNESAFDAAAAMLHHGVRHLVVTAGTQAVGLISIRDALAALINSTDPATTLAPLCQVAEHSEIWLG